ncbi:MAG: hypothetical protein AAGI11_15240 [Pseudomonadota bacterium]
MATPATKAQLQSQVSKNFRKLRDARRAEKEANRAGDKLALRKARKRIKDALIQLKAGRILRAESNRKGAVGVGKPYNKGEWHYSILSQDIKDKFEADVAAARVYCDERNLPY